MCGLPVLEKQYRLGCDVVVRNIAGDFVECGVCNGGSAAAVALAIRDSGRRAWLYDSFQGMPQPKAVDGEFAERYTGLCVGTEQTVQDAMAIAGFLPENCVIRKGWFQDTFKLPLPDAVSFLHIDADWYDSVSLSLNTFYDRVTEGGIIMLDDFGHWEGCREAFYDFANRRGLKPLLERFGYAQAFWIKGRIHNRDFKGQLEIP
jgi:O-methyltransferase